MTASFDHLTRGTPEREWLLEPRLRNLRRLTGPGAADHVLVLAAHPDDETLGAGGLIATAASRGARVDVIVATDGEASHPGSPTHTPDRLAAIRRREVRAAVHALAPAATVTTLGLPDGQVQWAADSVAHAVTAAMTSRTLLVTPWSQDRHPDHEACAQAGAAVAARSARPHWQYPIWLWHWGDPLTVDLPWEQAGVVNLDPTAQDAKARALACHGSQHRPLSAQPGDEAILPPTIVDHFLRDFETFVVDTVVVDTFLVDPFLVDPAP